MGKGIFKGEEVSEYNKLVKLCDDNGHLEPDEKENICHHCYRDLKVKALKDEELEAELKRRSNLPWNKQPYDAPVIVRRMDGRTKFAETLNYFTGLRRYMESLESA